RLHDGLNAGTPSVTCPLQLADGKLILLAGAFVEDDVARGLILALEPGEAATLDPGPDLVPAFQPIVSLQTQKIVGFEALARWQQDDGMDVIPSNLDDKALTPNMLIRSCEALMAWESRCDRDDLFIQVNLTSQDLADTTLPGLINTLITGFGLAPGRLRLELTEQAALRDLDLAVAAATALREAGAWLVLDDFGSGHSSFMWLAQLPAQSVKIDSTLIAALPSKRMETILEAVTLLARRLDMSTTAEGVEDRNQISALQRAGFDYAQGFALGRPMPLKASIELLKA
ncbi:MAG: EAL domain-containing protein, partial [Pseudomonadota bacterium]